MELQCFSRFYGLQRVNIDVVEIKTEIRRSHPALWFVPSGLTITVDPHVGISDNSTMRYATTKVGKRGVVVIPAPMRKHFGLDVGATVIAEERDEGVLFRPAVTLPVEVYTNARKAEFLLNNALPGEDYARAREAVKAFGIDPDSISHIKPKTVRKKRP